MSFGTSGTAVSIFSPDGRGSFRVPLVHVLKFETLVALVVLVAQVALVTQIAPLPLVAFVVPVDLFALGMDL